MSTLKWQVDRVGAPLTVMTTELNSLGNGSGVISSVVGGNGIITNAAEMDLYADFALTMQFGAVPTAGYPVELFIVRSLDGITFDDTSSAPPAKAYGDTFPVRAVTTVQTIIIPMVELPPANFKVYIRNSSGQAMVAANNVLKMLPYKRQVV